MSFLSLSQLKQSRPSLKKFFVCCAPTHKFLFFFFSFFFFFFFLIWSYFNTSFTIDSTGSKMLSVNEDYFKWKSMQHCLYHWKYSFWWKASSACQDFEKKKKKKNPLRMANFFWGVGPVGAQQTNIFLRSAQLHSHKIILILATLLKFPCQMCCLTLRTRSVLSI